MFRCCFIDQYVFEWLVIAFHELSYIVVGFPGVSYILQAMDVFGVRGEGGHAIGSDDGSAAQALDVLQYAKDLSRERHGV